MLKDGTLGNIERKLTICGTVSKPTDGVVSDYRRFVWHEDVMTTVFHWANYGLVVHLKRLLSSDSRERSYQIYNTTHELQPAFWTIGRVLCPVRVESRVKRLIKTKIFNAHFKYNRPSYWKVSTAAKCFLLRNLTWIFKGSIRLSVHFTRSEDRQHLFSTFHEPQIDRPTPCSRRQKAQIVFHRCRIH